jgi:hypothetical protein
MGYNVLVLPPEVAPEKADQGLAVGRADQGGLVLKYEGGQAQEGDLEGVTLDPQGSKHESKHQSKYNTNTTASVAPPFSYSKYVISGVEPQGNVQDCCMCAT